MYTNLAYLGEEHEDIVDLKKPLIVTAAGYYRVHTTPVIETNRPKGRGDYQLLYIAEGKVHFYFDGQETIVTKGNMILFRPGEEQDYDLYAADHPETYWVHFTGADVESVLDRHQMPKHATVLFTGTSPDYQWLFQQMIQELQLRRVNFDEILVLNLRHIFVMMNRYMKEGRQVGSEMLDEVEKAAHYFREHYNKDISIEQYAKQRLMTPCWFIQNFKKITKKTPLQYIVSLRMTNAMNMLVSTNYNIAQIANAVGYENALYFSRIFKKNTGVSPKEYRQNRM